VGENIAIQEVKKTIRIAVLSLRKQQTETEVRRFLEATLNEARRGS
jgi:hypothetical protein